MADGTPSLKKNQDRHDEFIEIARSIKEPFRSRAHQGEQNRRLDQENHELRQLIEALQTDLNTVKDHLNER